ncbi:MAG: hypothetical protein ACRCYZ_06840 [Alphaproteobacteria bacterium]
MTTRSAFAATLEGYVGTPYVHQGRVPRHGMDCVGPVICASRVHGLVPPDFDVTDYGPVPDGATLQAYCDQHMRRITPAEIGVADVLLCRFRGAHPQHLMVVVEIKADGRMYAVHSSGPAAPAQVRRSVVRFDDRWFGLVQAYRIPGIDQG